MFRNQVLILPESVKTVMPANANVNASKTKKNKKGRGGLVFLLILLFLLGSAAALLYFNVYSIRDMLYDRLRGVPIVGALIPADETIDDRYTGMSTNQLKAWIENLEKQVDSLTKERSALQEDISAGKREIDRLKEYEESQEQFKIDQQAFFDMVYNSAPLDFWQFYQEMNPDQSAVYAQEAAEIAQNDKDVRNFLATVRNMDERAAAQAMELLMDTDATYVRDVMNGLSVEFSAAILDRMGTEKRAALLKLMKPDGF